MKVLSARRPVHKIQWSAQMRELLGESFDDLNDKESEKNKKIPKTTRSCSSLHSETDYTVKKRALNSSIERRLQKGRKQIKDQSKRDDKELIRSIGRPQSKNTKATRMKIHDDHVIERVIDSRNEEYIATAEILPNGRVADLRKARQLPPDRTAFVRSEHRVFYWG